MQIGIIGLGAMGQPMARNLVAAGHRVSGYDVRASALSGLTEAGGLAAASAAEAARQAEALLLMVVNADQADAVLFEDGAAAAMAAGGVVIASYTQSAARARAAAQRLEAMGLAFLDAPVSGGAIGAAAGALSVMASGSETAFRKAEPVLAPLAKRVWRMGTEPGLGSMMKTVNQLLCGAHIAVAAEGLALAARAGLDPALAREVLSSGAAASWMLDQRGPRMLQDEPEVASAVDIFVKDLGLVLDAGRELRAGLPLAAAAHQMFLAASGLGYGAADDSQVLRAYEALNAIAIARGEAD